MRWYACEGVGLLLAASAVCLAWSSAPSGAQTLRTAAATMEQRLQAVEAKTGFYTASTKKVSLKYQKGQSTASCGAGRMVLHLDPALTLAGDLYSWTSLQIKFTGFTGRERSMVLFHYASSKPQNECRVSTEISQGASQKLKVFCKFDVAPADTIDFVFGLVNERGTADACQYIASVKLDMKLLSIGVSEPD